MSSAIEVAFSRVMEGVVDATVSTCLSVFFDSRIREALTRCDKGGPEGYDFIVMVERDISNGICDGNIILGEL
jgi:hypothetical protein